MLETFLWFTKMTTSTVFYKYDFFFCYKINDLTLMTVNFIFQVFVSCFFVYLKIN